MAVSTWAANSRVGSSTRARERGSCSPRSDRMGSAKAAVLPVPVGALPMTSRPDMIRGMALNWMGVGSVYPIAFTPSITAGDNPKLVNDMKHNTLTRQLMQVSIRSSHHHSAQFRQSEFARIFHVQAIYLL